MAATANGAAVEPLGWGWSGAAELTVSRSSAGLLLLNLLDGLFTLLFLQLGYAEEANPIMRMAYEDSPAAFMITKLAVVNLGVILLALCRHAPPARTAMTAGAALYGGIVLYHLSFLASLVTS